MTETIGAFQIDGSKLSVTVSNLPDRCPVCNNNIQAIIKYTYEHKYFLQMACLCPNQECFTLFIAQYRYSPQTSAKYSPIRSYPIEPEKVDFTSEITEVSEKFVSIYNQAKAAEEFGLDEICGPGYRKAFEFLIKDYAISIEDDDSKHETIAREKLGQVISNHINDERIKNTANRATWLGNDETHYIRRWESMGITELKDLIRLAVNWIDTGLVTDKYVEKME